MSVKSTKKNMAILAAVVLTAGACMMPVQQVGATTAEVVYQVTDGTSKSMASGTSLEEATAKISDTINAVSDGALAIGDGTKANNNYSTAVGQNAKALGTSGKDEANTAFGYNATANTSGTTERGEDGANVGAYRGHATAVGEAASATGDASTAVGSLSQASGSESVALGDASVAKGKNSIALGVLSTASGENSVALGKSSTASGANSVALGKGSVASAANVVSVGSGKSGDAYETRKITNVTAGTATTDAVNYGQLSATNANVTKNTTAIATNTTAIAGNTTAINTLASQAVTSVVLTGHDLAVQTGTGESTKDNTKHYTVATTDNSVTSGTVDDAGNLTLNKTDAVSGATSTVTVTGVASTNYVDTAVNAAKTVLQAGTNTYVSGDGTTKKPYQVNLKSDISGLNSVASTTITAGNTVTAGSGTSQVVIGTTDPITKMGGVTVGGTTYITGAGVTGGGNKITNVAAGTADTDAVNLSQLNEVKYNTLTGISATAADTNTGGSTVNYTKLATDGTTATTKVGTFNTQNYKLSSGSISGSTLTIVEKDVLGGGADNSINITGVASTAYVDGIANVAKDGNYIAAGTAVGSNLTKLDNAIGQITDTNTHYNVTKIDGSTSTVASNLESLDKAIGDNANHASTNIIKNGSDVNTNLSNLDKAIGSNTGHTSTNIIKDGSDVNTNLSNLDKAIGTTADGNYVKAASSVGTNLGALDSAIGTTSNGTYVSAGNSVGQNLNALDTGLNGLKDDYNDLDDRMNKVGAASAALAALHPQDFDATAKWDFAAGYGHYKGANAGAIGAFYRPNEDWMFSVGGTLGSEKMINAGISFKFGQSSGRASRSDLEKRINDLENRLNSMSSSISGMIQLLDLSKKTAFPDVPENHWAYEAVTTLAGNDVIHGYPDGNYGGDRTLTRYEMAELIYNAMKKGVHFEEKLVKEFSPEIQAMQKQNN